MKKLFLIAIFSAAFLTVQAQNRVPNLSIENERGQRVELVSIVEQGKPIIYVFWGAICGTCNTALNTLSDEFDTWRDEYDFQLIAVCTEDIRGSSKAKSKAIANDWPFTLLFDKNQDLKRAMNVVSVPYFIVTDKEGNIVYSRAGYIPGTEQEIYDSIKKSYE